jgi:hypothetical protein
LDGARIEFFGLVSFTVDDEPVKLVVTREEDGPGGPLLLPNNGALPDPATPIPGGFRLGSSEGLMIMFDIAHIRWSEMRVRLAGPPPTKRVTSLIENVKSWWAHAAQGQHIPSGGRPRLEDEPDQSWKDIVERVGGLRRTRRLTVDQALAREGGVSKSQYYEWKRRLRSEKSEKPD